MFEIEPNFFMFAQGYQIVSDGPARWYVFLIFFHKSQLLLINYKINFPMNTYNFDLKKLSLCNTLHSWFSLFADYSFYHQQCDFFFLFANFDFKCCKFTLSNLNCQASLSQVVDKLLLFYQILSPRYARIKYLNLLHLIFLFVFEFLYIKLYITNF